MGKIALSLKINVSQIDKMRLFAGQKGKYLDATIFVDLDQLDQYGNSGMITQDVSKDEKAQGVKGNILGNGKVFWVENGQAPQPQNQTPQQQGGFSHQNAPQQTGGFQSQTPAPQQAPQNNAHLYNNQSPQQQAPKVNPQEPNLDFDDDLPF